MFNQTLIRGRSIVATSLLALVAASAAVAQDRPSLNLYGSTGLLDMPSAEMQPDGFLTVSSAHFGPISRTTLSFQIAPRMSASFRYLGIRNWKDAEASDPSIPVSLFETYYDRSFDLRYQLLRETDRLPSVTVGFQDFVGTGILSGEYVAATKNVGHGVKVTGGLGWGRLGSYGDIGTPFGARDKIDIGEGGKFNFGQWFRGPVAPFAGVEWQATDKLAVKAEYSSDAYVAEADKRKTFDRKSPFNFGVEYKAYDTLTVGGYYMYGSEVGIGLHFAMNPKQRPMGSIKDTAPETVKIRPNRATDPDAWSPEWITQEGVGPLLISSMNKRLAPDGLEVEALGFTGSLAQVRVRNNRYDASAQAVGRVARAMANVLPASIEAFEIIPLSNGMPAAKVTLRRSDLERLEFSPNADAEMRNNVTIGAPGQQIAGLAFDPERYPRFTWALGPYNRIRLFDQRAPFKMDVGLRLSGNYELGRGFVLSGAATKKLAGNLDDAPPDIATGLQPVRSDVDIYDAKADPALESLMLSKYAYLGHDVYGRVSVGYLERMFGGVSAEVLYKPVDRRWAVGAEMNYVAQRSTNGGLGLAKYSEIKGQTQLDPAGDVYKVATGHISGYYAFPQGYNVQLDVGRYLAGDVGATLSLDREFQNGWRVGAFATKTDVSEADFGSGSFDKGITLEIPFAWGTGAPSRKTAKTTIRPFGRDGGARLEVEGRLYETVRSYDASNLDGQWGRFWK